MGVCNNPNSYYFDTDVRHDFVAEECGMRRCGTCPHYYEPESDPVVRTSESLIEELKRIDTMLQALKSFDGCDEETKQELIRELQEKRAEVEMVLKEFRRSLSYNPIF